MPQNSPRAVFKSCAMVQSSVMGCRHLTSSSFPAPSPHVHSLTFGATCPSTTSPGINNMTAGSSARIICVHRPSSSVKSNICSLQGAPHVPGREGIAAVAGCFGLLMLACTGSISVFGRYLRGPLCRSRSRMWAEVEDLKCFDRDARHLSGSQDTMSSLSR